jgi:hypothetical protein
MTLPAPRVPGGYVLIARKILESELMDNRLVAEAAKDMRPAYRTKVLDIVKCVIALSKAVEREAEFRDDLRKEGIGTGSIFGNGMTFTKIGHLSDRNSRAAYYLRDVIYNGWFTEAEIEDLKKG